MSDNEKVRSQLDLILRSRAFSSSVKLRNFLSYVVTETIEGRADRIKSYSIAIEVFNRQPDFDVAQDGIVRTTANRLRAALERYYRLEGVNDPVVISLPKGRYIPEFFENMTDPYTKKSDNSAAFETIQASAPASSMPRFPRNFALLQRRVSLPLLVFCLCAIIFFATLTYLLNQGERTQWLPPIIMIQATTALTEDEPSKLLARSLPVRLSSALSQYDINSVTRALDSDDAHNDAERFPIHQSVYVVTSEVGAEQSGLVINWQFVDARTGAVLWSSKIAEKGDGYSIDILTHELVGEDALIRFFEKKKLPADPISGYVCVTHALNKLSTITDADRSWMSRCLKNTVAQQPDYAQAWALLTRVRVEESIAAADHDEIDKSKAILTDAWQSYQNAESLAPASWYTLHARLVLEFQQENFERFEALAISALERLPKNARERLVIASRFFALGKYQLAKDVNQETLKWITYPQSSDHLYLAADLYRQGQLNEARVLLEAQPVTNSKFYWILCAALASRLDDLNTATTALASLDKLSPGFSELIETDLHNRHFRTEFIREIQNDLNKARRLQ